MLVLHAAFRDGSLLLWGESSDSSESTRARQKKPAAAWFDSGAASLAAVAREVGLAPGASVREARQAVAWLPSVSNRALPSTTLLSEGAPPGDSVELAPWRVAVLPLLGEPMLHALAVCVGKRLLAPGVIVGGDLGYWAAALRMAAGLVARGQFLPGVKSSSESLVACWQPVVTGTDADNLRALAAAMPPVTRALQWDLEASPPQDSPQALLRGFLNSTVDLMVRSPQFYAFGTPESIHDRWIHALTSNAPEITGDRTELQSFAAHVEQWQRPIQVSERAPFRLCFRLEEPKEEGGEWQIAYLLLSTRDPSLLIPAAVAWEAKPRALLALGQNAAGIREYLLASLGEAARVCPRIEASLKEPKPGGFRVDAAGAHEFLRQTAPALEQSGFGVLLPAWWTRRGAQQRLAVRAKVKSPKMVGGSGLSLESIVTFDWQAALGNEVVSHAELAALARLKAPLVKVRGKWVEVNAADIEAALVLIQKKPGPIRLRDVVRMAIGGVDTEAGLEVEGVTADGWIGDLLAKLESAASLEELPPPVGLLAILRPYQLRGYSWLRFLKQWGLGACLADDMGLGKTVQALALLQHEYRVNGGRPALLLCPTSVVGNWQKEAARFTPELPVLVHHGASRRRGEAFEREANRHAIVISSYALLHRDLDVLKRVSWAALVLDEAQNIKNPETKQARAARSLNCEYRVALTGTPVENNVGDLWSIMEFLNPGFLGGESEFRKRFFVPIQVYGDKSAAARLRRITGPFILRRLKTDKTIIADLPDKLEMKVFCTLTKEQASLYEAVVNDATKAIEAAEGIARKGVVLAILSKLKQVCNHPAQFLKDHSSLAGRSGKLARLREMLEETLEVGDRSLIFTQFAEMGELMRRYLQENFGVEVLYLHGGTPKMQRDRMVERFAASDGPPIFLLSLKAGGTGLNLTAANHVFHFDRWWNPAVEDQATDRAFRIGQNRNVQVHKFLCVGTLEEKIDEMIELKKDVAGRVVGAGEAWLTELSNSELKNLFALRKEAVGE